MRVLTQGGGSSGAGYDAVATHMILGNANTASVDGGWLMADDREVVDQVLRNAAQITLASKTLSQLAASTADMNIVATSANARNAIGFAGAGYEALAEADMAIGKLVAGHAGLTPGDYAGMTDLAADASAMASVAASEGARDAVLASTTAMNKILASAAAKNEIWKSDAFLTDLLANSAAHDLARAAGGLHSKGPNGTTLIDLTTGVTGGDLSSSGKYLVLGASYQNIGADRSIVLATLRAGSSLTDTTPAVASDSGTTAEAADTVIPLEGPTLTFRLDGSGGGGAVYLRILDCTPPA